MIEGAKWRRWVYFYIPLGGFVFWLLFPFYWMLVTSIRPDRELPVQKLVTLMDALQRAEITKVGIATKADEK